VGAWSRDTSCRRNEAFAGELDRTLRAFADSLNTVLKLNQEDIRAMQAVVEAQEEGLRPRALSRKFDMEFHEWL
jgi:hypothetical protein